MKRRREECEMKGLSTLNVPVTIRHNPYGAGEILPPARGGVRTALGRLRVAFKSKQNVQEIVTRQRNRMHNNGNFGHQERS
jgi:hypothetical protein